MTTFSFDHEERPPVESGAADRVVVLLHGMGGSGARAIAQAEWLSTAFPRAHFYAPNGSFAYVPLLDPKAADMSSDVTPERFCWYHRYSEATRQEGLAETRQRLDHYVDECAAAHGVQRSRVALVGMSQGAITLLNCAPLLAEPVGVSVAHSGYLFSPDSLASRKSQQSEFASAVRNRTPACSIHGFLDQQLPWQTHVETAAAYDEAGIPVEFHLLSGLKHADFEPRSQAIAIEFIRRHLG